MSCSDNLTKAQHLACSRADKHSAQEKHLGEDGRTDGRREGMKMCKCKISDKGETCESSSTGEEGRQSTQVESGAHR